MITDVPVVFAGVCQRDVTSHFPGLAEQQDELSEIILEFYEQHIELRFPDSSCKPHLIPTVTCPVPMKSGYGTPVLYAPSCSDHAVDVLCTAAASVLMLLNNLLISGPPACGAREDKEGRGSVQVQHSPPSMHDQQRAGCKVLSGLVALRHLS